MKKIIILGLVFFSFNISQGEYLFKYSKNIEFSKENNEYSGKNVIVFRHINKDTEGWSDLIIAPAKNTKYIDSELTYRQAAQEAGFEGYYTRETSWRCDQQDYKYPEVPKIDMPCGDAEFTGNKYILYYKPNNIIQNPNFIFRTAEREYGVYGNGSWILRSAYVVNLEIGKTTYADVVSHSSGGMSTAEFYLNEGDWFLTSK